MKEDGEDGGLVQTKSIDASVGNKIDGPDGSDMSSSSLGRMSKSTRTDQFGHLHELNQPKTIDENDGVSLGLG